MDNRIEKTVVHPNLKISDAIPILDRSGLGVLLVCKDSHHLFGVITDGDIRRAMMKGIPFSESCEAIANKNPIIAPASITHEEALHLMDHARDFFVNHLPLLDGQGRVVGLLLRSDLTQKTDLRLSAVVMAGGFGTRLRPLTEDLPKPMLPVGDKPLLETVVSQLRDVGIKQLRITTHFKPEKIKDHFGDGHDFGVDISYVNEDQPLGTAGFLRLMDIPREPFLVINGDVLTRVNFESMYQYHQEHKSVLTVGVRKQDFQIPYGLIECQDTRVTSLKEKPAVSFLVNAGIYLLEPCAIDYIPESQFFHMTDLIQVLLDQGQTVTSFPIHEYWMDIGKHDQYKQAIIDFSGTFHQ